MSDIIFLSVGPEVFFMLWAAETLTDSEAGPGSFFFICSPTNVTMMMFLVYLQSGQTTHP